MLSHYSRQGDSNGLPIVSNSQWVGFVDDEYTTAELQGKAVENRARGRLVLSAREASYEIEKVRSIQRWSIAYLHPLSCPASQYLANTVIDVSNDKPIVEEIALLRGIKVIARTEKATLASDLEEKHKWVIALQGPQSHTEYDEQLGFLSSSWKTCTPASGFEELKARTFFLGSSCAKSLRQHSENDGCPSEWISLAREVSWTLKQVNEKWPMDDAAAENKIALISTARMERLGILCDQSNILIERAGESLFGRSNPHGVKFAWPGHYLVYGWIPVQCIVKTFTLSEFRDICSAHDIQPDGTESIDPYTLLPADSDAFVESIVGNMENLGL